MKKLFALPLAAVVALGACSDTGDMFTSPNDLNIGVSSPGTAVDATAQIAGPEQTIITYRTTPRNNQGSCNTTNGAWTNPGGNTSGPNHNQCTDVTTIPGFSINIEFATVANYVQPTSGNIHLNFSMCGYTEQVVGYDEELGEDILEWVQTPCTTPTFIHYKHNKKSNSGVIEAAGVLSGKDENGGVWTIDLAQLNGTPGAAGLANTVKEFAGLLATGPGGAQAHAELSW